MVGKDLIMATLLGSGGGSSGSGGGGSGLQMTTGTVTTGKDYSTSRDYDATSEDAFVVEHGLQGTPTGFVYFAVSGLASGMSSYGTLLRYYTEDLCVAYIGDGSGYDKAKFRKAYQPADVFRAAFINEGLVVLNKEVAGYVNGTINAGITYRWIAWK